MGKYKITLTDLALKQLKQHQKVGHQATLNKIEAILKELAEHPYTGIGRPEALKYDLTGYWSRRINLKDRIIYEVIENTVIVHVISAMGHYGEK